MNGSPEIDRQHLLPGALAVEDAAAGLDPGIVHKHVDAAELVKHGSLEPLHLGAARHVGRHGQDLAGTVHCSDLPPGGVQTLAAEIGKRHGQAHAGEASGRGQADAGSCAGDHSDVGGREGSMGHRASPPN